MLVVIEKKSEIKEAQALFERGMNMSAERSGSLTIGFPGGKVELQAYWSKELGMWWAFDELENRYWNAFGTEDPFWGSKYSHGITCVIDPPYDGIDRRIQGVFAEDSDGKCYLLHRGRIAGRGMGARKDSFEQEFRGKRIEVEDGDRFSKLALVAPVESPRLGRYVADFVHEVERIKAESVERTVPSPFMGNGFTEEFSGTKTFGLEGREIEAKCDHGIVANALAKQLGSVNAKVGNNQYVDLYVVDKNNEVQVMFEIKASATKYQCYEAIGQLLFNSVGLKNKPRLVAVFPGDINRHSQGVLEKLGIHCLTYTWDKDEPVFDKAFNIGRLLAG